MDFLRGSRLAAPQGETVKTTSVTINTYQQDIIMYIMLTEKVAPRPANQKLAWVWEKPPDEGKGTSRQGTTAKQGRKNGVRKDERLTDKQVRWKGGDRGGARASRHAVGQWSPAPLICDSHVSNQWPAVVIFERWNQRIGVWPDKGAVVNFIMCHVLFLLTSKHLKIKGCQVSLL